MPNFLEEDTMIAQNFFLEVDGEVVSYLSGVSGLDLSMDVAESVQAAADGKKVIRKMLGTHIKPPDLTLTRVAPPDMSSDKMWTWFNSIAMNTITRQTVVVNLMDETGAPRMIWTLNNAFPTKLTGTDMKSDGNEVAVESIEIAYETQAVSIK